MGKRICILAAIAIPFMALCQKPYTDTGANPPGITALPPSGLFQGNTIKPAKPVFMDYNLALPYNPGTMLNDYKFQPRSDNTSQRFIFDTNKFTDESTLGIIKQFDNNFIAGSGDFLNLPALGAVRRANIFYVQNFGRFSFSGGVTASKYHLATGVYNNFGIYGAAHYALNENLTFNVFGAYHTNNTFYSAAAMPYLSNSYYGASMSMAFNEKLGLTLGAQRHFDPYSRRWITTPIVAPSFKIGNQSVEIDLGGLIKLGIDNLYNAPRGSGNKQSIAPNKNPVLVKSVDLLGR